MKSAIVFLIVLYVGLELLVKRAEHRSKELEEQQRLRREQLLRDRNNWLNGYR